ncbi:hypothetical protein GCM10029976_066300 [Kribbella albertanoniae]|nr:RNaseH domain-containing protein [Kribbella albertanoniae]
MRRDEVTSDDRDPGKYLNTLAFRCTPELVGDSVVHVRQFDDETWKLWDDFDTQCKRKYRNDDAQVPYSIATTVLSMTGGGYVYLGPGRTERFLASLHPIDDKLLRRVFTLTYHLALGEDGATIELGAPPELAKRIADTPEVAHRLSNYLEPADNAQPAAPGWLYRTIAWELSRHLAAEPWEISDSKNIRLRSDTTGGLVALDDPWENDQGGRFALSRTALKLKTMPNIGNPVLLLSSRVTRISSSLVFSKTALAEQAGLGRPLLEFALNGRGGARTINRLALEALGRLQVDSSILRTIHERSQREQQLLAAARERKEPPHFPAEHPGQVWPVLPKNYRFPIGTGTGMQHLRLLHQHFTKVFSAEARPLEMREVKMAMPHRPTDPENISKLEYERRKAEREQHPNPKSLGPIKQRGTLFPAPEAILASVQAVGRAQLRIVCLWYRDETRLRMLDTFCKSFGLSPDGLDPRDGDPLPLYGDKVVAVFHNAASFLEPGLPDGRRQALADLGAAVQPKAGVLVGAWCETEIPLVDDTGVNPDDIDGKPQSKMLLAPLGVSTQYLKGRDDQGTVIQPTAKDDHPAEKALLDLYRSLGILDDRIANALQPEKAGYAVDQIAHVGIHVRQQNRRKGEFGQPKVVITATALVPPKETGGTWTMLGWSSTNPNWQHYSLAQPAFHASAYPEIRGDKGTYRQRWDGAAESVEGALADLVDELHGTPYVVTMDESTSRRMWDGLQNGRLSSSPEARNSRHWLPGSTLHHDERPRAIIRINIDADEVPQPVGSTHLAKAEDSAPKDQATATTLYEVTTDFGSPVWILPTVPRSYDGAKAGRLGAEYTRWDAKRSVASDNKEDRRKGEMPQNWYSMKGTEIYPLTCADDVSAEALAITTAKLCHQAQFWDSRTRYPVPLHAAKQMDEDHPQYRRTIAYEAELVIEPGIEET